VKQETQGREHQPATTAEHCMFTAAAAVDQAAVIRALRAKKLPIFRFIFIFNLNHCAVK
jgi:hypothetical protein